MRIAVAGATGRVGTHTIDVIKETGHEPVGMSRATGVDVITGDGLAAALTDVDVIIDAATGPSPEEAEATAFFTTATRNLQESGAHAGVSRIVVVSIVGIDRLTGGYNKAKLAHEQAMRSGPVPVRILRATQFHEFVPQLIEWGRDGEISYVQRMRSQLVAARSVAEALVDLAVRADAAPTSGPAEAPFWEIAGPRPEDIVDMAALYAARHGDPVRIEGVSNPDDPDARTMATGGLLPGPHATLAGPTFEAWLDSAP